MDLERDRLLAMAREEYAKDRSIKETDIEELVGEMIQAVQIPKEGDRKHFHKTAYTFDNINIYNHYKKKYKEFKEHCHFIMEGKTEIITTLYRGSNAKRDFKIGRTKFTGVASWTKDKQVAEEFGEDVYILEGPKWATSLDEFSIYPAEKEFLVTSNIQVRVRNIFYVEENLFGRLQKRRHITFEVIDDVQYRHADTDSGYSEPETSDVAKRETFLPDGSVALPDDFLFHMHLLKSSKSKR